MPMIIGGRQRLASDGGIIDSFDPATGELIGRIPAGTAEDATAAVDAAATAFTDWRRVDPSERAALLYRLADVIDAHADELARIDVADNGSPITEMRNDITVTVTQIRYLAGLVMQVRGDTAPSSFDRLNYTLRQPYGVVVRIVPFNHPLLFAATKIAAPLAAGNTIILKPSEYTSMSALRLGELAADVFPAGVVNVVTGYGHGVGDALVTDPRVRRLAFTGSARTGRAIVARAAGVNVKTVTLELGGKNPLVIFPDADQDLAVDAAVRGMNFTWQGQSCGSTSRLLVHESVYPEFTERLAARIAAIEPGMPTDPATTTGSMVNAEQRRRVTDYVAMGQDEGARLLTGGDRVTSGEFAKGHFVRPALFADVAPGSRLAQEEIFGPVLAALRYHDDEEALAIANGIPYGLTASVFTRDLARAHRFARDIEAGYVWINEVSRHVLGAGFGGMKDSGMGREEDLDEIVSYTQLKNVHVNMEPL
jgi:acyl-CoA reductase-like NAD-dependent aldehyde dehydrogenase